MANIGFTDNSIKIKQLIGQKAVAFLEEASGELEAQVRRNTVVDTGQTKGSWRHKVDEKKMEAYIGSDLENAIWEEFGTGEYALHGDGRKGGWKYQDARGHWHSTLGKKPRRPLWRAYTALKSKIISYAEQQFKGLGD